MKKFFAEFKKFISRGNVMDMAVGTIIGAAFTAIVTALSNGILKPLINTIIYYCAGGNKDALDKMYTVLVKAYAADGVTIDLANSILIDWGAFISAIINFLLVAIVLFVIIKTFNTLKETGTTARSVVARAHAKQEKGLSLTKKEQEALEKEAEEKAVAEEKAKAEAEAAAEAKKHSTEALLEDIKAILEKTVK